MLFVPEVPDFLGAHANVGTIVHLPGEGAGDVECGDNVLVNDVLFNDPFSPVVSYVTVHFCFLGCRLLTYSAGFVWN